DVVEQSAIKAGDRADDEPENRGDDGDEDADLLRRTDPEDDPAEEVASDLVSAEEMMSDRRRRGEHLRQVDLIDRVRRDVIREDARCKDEYQPDKTSHRETVAQETAARVRP